MSSSPAERADRSSPGPGGAGRTHETEAAFRELFDNALVGMGVADMHGNLLAFNDAMLAPGGYEREDIERLGNVSLLYASGEERARVLDLVRAQGYVWREEVQFLRKDGSAYDTHLTLTPVRFQGRPCLYATVEDITEQKRSEAERQRLEKRLWKAQKMEAVGEMTAGIAHDFNNLLAIIQSGCDLLDLALENDPAEAKEHLETVRQASRRGAAMIRKLLGFSRTAALELAPTNLATLVEGMCGMLDRVVPSGVEVELAISGGETCLALCDGGAVEQMVLNLVTNARDAMPNGGSVRLSVETVEKGGEGERRPHWMPDGTYVRLAVTDTGVGMDEETLGRAVEPFFTTKPPGAGTGLGLPMVFGLAKQQGGFLDLESEPGKGTTVSLYFPTGEA